MKKKPCNPLRPRRSKQASASNERPAGPGAALGSNIPLSSNTAPSSIPQMRHLSMSQHSHNLLKFLNEDRTRQRFCDVSVSVGGKLYGAHKVVLAHGSSYFHAELSKNAATTCVTLDHVEDPVFSHLLGFLYTSECTVAETDLPALAEAARFLDMMDILKLLCEEGGNSPVCVTEHRGSPEVEIPSSDKSAGSTDIQSSSDDPSLQINLHESRPDVHQETPVEKEKRADEKTPTTRRSARRRKTPTKYQRDDMEFTVSSPEGKLRTVSPRKYEEERAGEAGGVDEEHQGSKVDLSKREDEVMDEEEADEGEEGDVNEDVVAREKVAEACTADKSVAQQGSDVEGVEAPAVVVPAPAPGTSTQSPVYPEGLAPVIIQTSTKKTLKCPKCDKTFDRAGGNQV